MPNNPEQSRQAAETTEQDENDHLDRLAEASKESPLTLAAALEDSLVELGVQAADRETEEIAHGRGELEATLSAMGVTAAEKKEALDRYDREFKDSEGDLAEANEKDRENWVQKLKTGALDVRAQKYEGDKAVMDERISSLDLALASADRRIQGRKEGIRVAERAFTDAKSGLESEAKNLFGKRVDYATLRDSPPEELTEKLTVVLQERGAQAGLPITESMAAQMAQETVGRLKVEVDQIKVKESAVASAKSDLGTEEARKVRLQEKKKAAIEDRRTMVADYDKDVRSMKDGTYVLPGGTVSLTDTAHSIADTSFTQEELDLIHGYTEKSGEMVRTLTLEVVGKRIKEARDSLRGELERSEALVTVREGWHRSRIGTAQGKAEKAAKAMGVSWQEVKGAEEADIKEKMAESLKERGKRAGMPFTDTMIEDMVAGGYTTFDQAKKGYEAAIYAQNNDAELATHRARITQYTGEIQTLDEYMERNPA